MQCAAAQSSLNGRREVTGEAISACQDYDRKFSTSEEELELHVKKQGGPKGRRDQCLAALGCLTVFDVAFVVWSCRASSG